MRRGLSVAIIAIAGLLLPAVAHAAFPGANGKIAFERGSGSDIFTINPDGSDPTNLTSLSGGSDRAPDYSPDGKKIAFTSDRDGNAEIYVMSANGTGPTRITTDPDVDDHAAWSPDGTKLAFIRGSISPCCNYDIYVMNANGSGITNISNNSAPFDVGPVWSPDGTKILFTSDRDGNDDIYTMNPDGSGVTRLTTNGTQDYGADWSPDGKRILFSRFTGGTDYEVHTMNRDGTGEVLIGGNPANDFASAWSPDGSKVLFQSDRDTPPFQQIYVMNIDGSGVTQLTNTTNQEFSPTWQPLYEIPQSSPPLSVGLVPSYRPTISATQCAARGGSSTSHAPPLSLSACNPPGYLPGTVARFGIQAVGSASLTVVPGNPATVVDEADHAIVVDLTDIRAGSPLAADYNPVGAGPDATMLMRFRLSDTLNGPNQADPGTVPDSELAVPVDCATTADPAIGSHCAATTSADGLTAGLVKEGRNAVTSLFRVRLRDSGANGIRSDGDDREFATQGVYTP